jgi:hypothetical protein
MPLLFALFCFIIAWAAFSVAFIAAHIWLAATILLRLTERRLRHGGAMVLRLGLFGQRRRHLVLIGRCPPAWVPYSISQSFLRLAGRRPVEGNRSKSGRARPSTLLAGHQIQSEDAQQQAEVETWLDHRGSSVVAVAPATLPLLRPFLRVGNARPLVARPTRIVA